MIKKILIPVTVFVTLALLIALVLFATGTIAATQTETGLTGTWSASLSSRHKKEGAEKKNSTEKKEVAEKTDSNRIYLSFERQTAKGGHQQMGQSYEFTDLQGLTREQALSGGPVKFSLVREAGRIDCEGSFENGKGSGTYHFTGNPDFIAAMKSRGFDFEGSSRWGDSTENRLFSATALNV